LKRIKAIVYNWRKQQVIERTPQKIKQTPSL